MLALGMLLGGCLSTEIFANDKGKVLATKVVYNTSSNPSYISGKKEAIKKISAIFNYAEDNSYQIFVKEDLIVYLKYKNGQQRNYNRTSKNLGNFPLIVLTNKASASASEIVTGAIKDYKRGTIIGEKTFGKGIVQQVIPLRTEDAIKLTIAQYFTPKGNYIHEKGIEPDIEVKMEELLTLKGYANDSEQARKNREKEIEDIIIKDKGKEEAAKIISAGDVQLKRAIQEMNKKIK